MTLFDRFAHWLLSLPPRRVTHSPAAIDRSGRPTGPLRSGPASASSSASAPRHDPTRSRAARARLTPMQWRVLVEFARTGSVKTAATNLGMATETARSHLKAVYERLDAHNHADAWRVAGLLILPEDEAAS